MKRSKNRTAEHLETRKLLAADIGLNDDLLLSETDPAETVLLGTKEPSTLSTDSFEISDALFTTQSDVVLDWNDFFGDLLVADTINQNPGYASRSMAMLNLAIYDAVTLVSGNFEDTFYDYAIDLDSYTNVTTEVVASQAAYTVLSPLYPDQQEMLGSFLLNALANFDTGGTAAESTALGTEIGNQILLERANDGSSAVVDYTFTEGAGFFQVDPLNPDVPVWGPAWGEVDTFAISSVGDFAPQGTPELTSEEYAASYNEVLELGAAESTVRTADQTEAGLFWAYDNVGLGTPVALYNDVLGTIAQQQGNTLEENAALYAQASVAMADAAIVAWSTKFGEEFWRPVTAIQSGDSDGNPLTEGNADWTALGAPDGDGDIVGFTPQFPTYISGHATFGGALFGTLQEFYGTDDIAFELTSNELELLLEDPDLQAKYGLELEDAIRSFDSFSEAMAENGRSRVYLGIHFDFDDLDGQEVGQSVATTVASKFVVPTNGGDVDIDQSVLRFEIAEEDVARELIVSVDDSSVKIVDASSGAILESRVTEDTSQVQIINNFSGSTNITIDMNTEAPVLANGIIIDGGNNRNTVVNLSGTENEDAVVVDGNSVTINATTIEYANIDSIFWHGADDDITTIDDGDAQWIVVDGDHKTHDHSADRSRDRHRDDHRANDVRRSSPSQREDTKAVDQVFRNWSEATMFSPLGRELFNDNRNENRKSR